MRLLPVTEVGWSLSRRSGMRGASSVATLPLLILTVPSVEGATAKAPECLSLGGNVLCSQ